MKPFPDFRGARRVLLSADLTPSCSRSVTERLRERCRNSSVGLAEQRHIHHVIHSIPSQDLQMHMRHSPMGEKRRGSSKGRLTMADMTRAPPTERTSQTVPRLGLGSDFNHSDAHFHLAFLSSNCPFMLNRNLSTRKSDIPALPTTVHIPDICKHIFIWAPGRGCRLLTHGSAGSTHSLSAKAASVSTVRTRGHAHHLGEPHSEFCFRTWL